MRAVLAGSFDPITLGHMDIIRRGRKLFDEIIVACGHNVRKKYTLDLEQRLAVIEACVADIPDVHVEAFDGLLVDFCHKRGAGAILRGLRAVADFDFEFQTGLANMDMAPDIETVFLMAGAKNIFLSSSLIKEIAYHGGDVSRYLPPPAHAALLTALPPRA